MPEPETIARDLACTECGRKPHAGETWQVYFVDLGEVALYCPDCSERDFGEPA